MNLTFAATVMVPDFPPREKHPAIFNTFHSLQSGEIMQIINDHDPKPLYYQLIAERGAMFSWALREGILDRNPCRGVEQARHQRVRRRDVAAGEGVVAMGVLLGGFIEGDPDKLEGATSYLAEGRALKAEADAARAWISSMNVRLEAMSDPSPIFPCAGTMTVGPILSSASKAKPRASGSSASASSSTWA